MVTRMLQVESSPALGQDGTIYVGSNDHKLHAVTEDGTEKWAYVFFIEFEGHMQDENVAGIVRELEEQSILLKPLGSYPQAVL